MKSFIIPVDGNPPNEVAIRGDNGWNVPLIMKDGKICNNALK